MREAGVLVVGEEAEGWGSKQRIDEAGRHVEGTARTREVTRLHACHLCPGVKARPNFVGPLCGPCVR